MSEIRLLTSTIETPSADGVGGSEKRDEDPPSEGTSEVTSATRMDATEVGQLKAEKSSEGVKIVDMEVESDKPAKDDTTTAVKQEKKPQIADNVDMGEDDGSLKDEDMAGQELTVEMKNHDKKLGAEEDDSGEVDMKDDESKDQTPEMAKGDQEKGQQKVKQNARSQSRKSKDLLRTPSPYALNRPMRERKTVERLVQVVEKVPSTIFVIEKGRGTPLRDIPNVAYKLTKRKPGDLKVVHRTLFGRRGKVSDFKNHILQFSGFAWHDGEEKQKARMKEKLDKHVKDVLLDMCDLFDIPSAKTNLRKEDLVAKLLDFIAAPKILNDVILSEEQLSSPRKRKRAAKGRAGSSKGAQKRSRKKLDNEGVSTAKGSSRKAENDADSDDHDESENESVDEGRDADGVSDHEEDDHESEKDEQNLKPSEGTDYSSSEKSDEESERNIAMTPTKRPTQVQSKPHKRSVVKGHPDSETKVSSGKKRGRPPTKSIPNAAKDAEKNPSGKRAIKGKRRGSNKEEGPTREELRATIQEILKTVDFNKATFSDVVQKLAAHYKMDMTPRKAAVKLLIQEELTKLADRGDEEDD